MSDLPPGWVEAQLSDIAVVQLGRQRSPENHLGPNMRPYLRAANVTWDGLALDDVKEMNFSPAEMTTFRLIPGDVLLSEASGSASEVGKPAIWQGEIDDCCFQNTLLRVRTKSPDPRYLLWVFKWLAVSGQFARDSRGVGIHHLGTKALSEWQIPVAPKVEQKRIVAAIEEQLSQLDAGIAALKRSLRNLQRMRDALFELTVPGGSENWESVTIQDSVRVVDYRGRTPPFSAVGVPHLRSFNVKDGRINWDGCTWVSKDTYDKYMSRGLPSPGDLLFTTEAPMGEVALAPEKKFCMAQRMMLLKPDPAKWLPEYLMYHLRSPWFRERLRLNATGTTVRGISSRNFRPLRLYLPPLRSQAELASRIREHLSAIQHLEQELKTVSERSRQLYGAILKAAFEGNLVPQDPNDELGVVLLDGSMARQAIND
jgi:type I restriction enzyme, S subunit